MKFDSKQGQEVRTWILFFVGIVLAVIFALNGNPLNPWWTLVIGAFTSTAIIISAVQAVTGGMKDANRKTSEEQERRSDSSTDSKEQDKPSLSIKMGNRFRGTLCSIRSRHTITI